MRCVVKIKPVQIKNYAFGTVRIIDPETQGESRNAPNPTAATSIAWNIYSLSSGAEDATSYHIYLPPFCLLFNGTYCPVEPK